MKVIVIKLRDSNRNMQWSGDIILTKSTEKFSNANVFMQRLVTGTKSSYTHALLCIVPGSFVEATIGSELKAFHYKDMERKSLDSVDWMVIRYKPLFENKFDYAEELSKSIGFHLGKGYSLINQETKSFCSSFIAMVYNDLFPNLFKNPNTTLPVTLENLPLNSEDWKNVTKDYKSQLEKSPILQDHTIFSTTEIFNLTYAHTVKAVNELKAIDDFNETMINVFGLKKPPIRKTSEKAGNWQMEKYLNKKDKKTNYK